MHQEIHKSYAEVCVTHKIIAHIYIFILIFFQPIETKDFYDNKDHQRMMVDPMFITFQNVR